MSHVRVVRFTDVDPERIAALVAQVEESDGAPPGVDITSMTFLHDASQGTAVVLQFFDTAEAMEAGANVFAAMDAGETPGTRSSVDHTELLLDMQG